LEERSIADICREQVDNMDSYGMIHGFHAVHISRVLREAQELKRLPLLLTMTGTDLYDLRMGEDAATIAAALDHAAAITVFNADFVSLLSRVRPAWGAKTNLIPQGVTLKDGEPLSRQSLGLSEKDIVFILPSGLRAIKNIEMAVDAINILYKSEMFKGKAHKGEGPSSKTHKNKSENKAMLIIAGPALEEDYAEHLLRRFELSPWIKYLGAVNHNDMKPLLQLADVVINCSRSEGQPQAALEAMSLGKPCILTAVPGNLNIIENYGEGIYVQDAEDLASAMDFYLSGPEQRKAMGAAAMELVAKEFSVEREISLYHALYRQIAS
jgi:glycosyltransferase involved in cell wall biosynthesis